MTLRSRATAVGLTATLLASLAATIAAPAVFAAGTVTPNGTVTVPRGDSYVGSGGYTFTEGAVNDFNAGVSITVTIADANGNSRVHFDTTSGTLTAPDSLGASLSVSDTSFTLSFSSGDPLRIEAASVTGLKIKADANAALGAIKTTYTTTGLAAGYFGGNTLTVHGTLAAALTGGADAAALVNLGTASSDYFRNTGLNDGTYTWGQYVINSGAANEDDMNGTASALGCGGTCTAGQQQLTFTAAVTNNHLVNEPVTQVGTLIAVGGTLSSIGTVVDSLALSAGSPVGLIPGIADQDLPNVTLAERDTLSLGLLAAGTTITAKFDVAGVVFSAPPLATATNCGIAGATSGYGTLSADRSTATWTVTTASTVAACSIVISSAVDVSNSVAGTVVNMVVTAGSIPVVPAKVEVGFINNVISASSQSVPTVFIGENDQATGTLDLKEAAAGSLSSAGGTNNLMICNYTGESFVRPATAVVIAGDLKFRDPSTLGPTASVAGTFQDVYLGALAVTLHCQLFPIYSASTVASTVEIREVATATGAANGAHVNVPGYLTPGQVVFTIGAFAEGSATGGTFYDQVVVAVRAYRNSPIVAATSAPAILRGHASQAAGDVTVTETSPYQLVGRTGGPNEGIMYRIVPNSLLDLINPRVYFNTGRDMPTVSTNASGLAAQFVGFLDKTSFVVGVTQAAQPPVLGVLTVSNIKYSTTADAPLGPVQLEVCTGSYSLLPISFTPDLCSLIGPRQGATTAAAVPTSDVWAIFDQVVTNAKVVSSVSALNADIAKGVTRTASAFTLSTVIVKKNTYVTVRIKAAGAAAGDIIQIWTKTKTGAWKATTSRIVGADGYAYYFTRAKGWLAYRGYFAGNDTTGPAWSNAVRALGK